MSIIGVVIALLVVASGTYVVVSGIRGPEVAPAVNLPHRPQFVRSELTARTDQEQLRRYFLQGLPDGPRHILP
jgi:hypothetical protein